MTTLAEAYANAGKALLDLADAVEQDYATRAEPAAAAVAPLAPYEEPPVEHGSAAVCPAHGKPYIDGRFGPYCRERGTDPRWTSEKGYCQVTPKSAAAYLRQKAGAAA